MRLTLLVLFISISLSCASITNLGQNRNTNETFSIEISIGNVGYAQKDFVYLGTKINVPINLKSSELISGFDLLIGYDIKALRLDKAIPGKNLKDNNWEYFIYKSDMTAKVKNNYPSGLVRITAIAETNNGSIHPTKSKISEVTILKFFITNDRSYECMKLPIDFYWIDCGDNSLYNWNQDALYISNKIYNTYPEKYLVDDSEIQNYNISYPTFLGAQDIDCKENNKPTQRTISFYNGSVQIGCFWLISTRGDINLNEIQYEIVDAELLANYFVYGLSVFKVNTDGQISLSDINADNLTLTVADLVYLIQVIIGEVLPYPDKAIIKPKYNEISYTHTSDGTISVHDSLRISAVHLVLEDEITPTLLSSEMTMNYHFDGTNTNILIFSLENNNFTGNLINIGDAEIVSIAMADHLANQLILTEE